MKYCFISFFIIMLVGCDNPASSLKSFKPDAYEYVYSYGGIKLLNKQSFDFTNDLLSKKSNKIGLLAKGEKTYEVLHSFLSSHHKTIGVFRGVSIPPRHVLLLYIKFQDKLGNPVNISLGRNWISYYIPVDSLGESSSVIYPVNDKEVLKLLLDLGKDSAHLNPISY